jgi:hypothetical protein
MDDAAFNTNPIADGGKISRARRLMPKPAADLGPPVGVAGDAIQAPRAKRRWSRTTCAT